MTADQAPDNKPGPYYVSAVDGPKYHLMAGPYAMHQDAISAVDLVRKISEDADRSGRAQWMAWGTVRVEGSDKIGQLNKFGLLP